MEGLCPYARAFVNDVAACENVDGVIITTLCDQMRRVFDLLVRRARLPAFLLNVPSTWQTVAAQRLYLDELKRLSRFLVRLGGRAPDRDELARAMLDPDLPGESGSEFRLQAGVRSTAFTRVKPSDLPSSLPRLRNVEPAAPEDSLARLKAELGPQTRTKAFGDPLRTHETNRTATGRPSTRLGRTESHGVGVPIAVVGGPLMQRDQVLFDIIRDCGGQIVLDATETGARGRHGPFDRRRLADDPLLELAQTYFRIPDAGRRPNSELYEWLQEELHRSGARGILFHHYVWCDKWRAELARLKEWVGLAVLGLDSDGNGEMSLARLRSRVRAFLEMLE